MRNFLTDIHIVGCIGVWQEGDSIHYCLKNLLSICDHIVIVMDWPDEKTRKIIEWYKVTYPDVFFITDSNVPALKNPLNVKRRAKVYGSQLVEAKLNLVKKIHNEIRKVDILLTPDSDEVFTDSFPKLLEDFWESNKTSICIKSIDVYRIPCIIHNKGMVSHWRVYKYNQDSHFTPRRYRDFYYPYKYRDTMHSIGYFVHLSQLNENLHLRKILRNPTLLEASPNANLWILNKPAWELTSEEYFEIIAKEQNYILKDYEKLFN